MWDTARESSRLCDSLTPRITQQSSIARNESYQHPIKKHIRRAKSFVRDALPLLNYQDVDREVADTADLHYFWGAFPKRPTKPYIVELDNPYVLSYYDTSTFNFRMQTIKRKLMEAHHISCFSHTVRNHMIHLVGDEIAEKSTVLYPFMDENYKNRADRRDDEVRFLFVGLGFRRKGGPELLEAFSKLPQENLRLTVIANVPDEIMAAHQHDTRITFVPPQPREVLFEKYYPTHDIFVMPTLLETFGTVLLEALSFGMGIITTDAYATGEMVDAEKNGRILSHPFLSQTIFNSSPTIDCVTAERSAFESEYLSGSFQYTSLIENLHQALKSGVEECESWQGYSVALFKHRFAPKVWEQSLEQIFK